MVPLVKGIVAITGICLTVLVAVLAVRTAGFRLPPSTGTAAASPAVERGTAAAHLAQATAFRTVSHHDPGATDRAVFERFVSFLEATYPALNRTLARERVGPGVDRELALIGIAEKGYLSVELSVAGTGGHSSAPPPQSAVGILAAAITALEREQMPAHPGEVTRQTVAAMGPAFPVPTRALTDAASTSARRPPTRRRRGVSSSSGDRPRRTGKAPRKWPAARPGRLARPWTTCAGAWPRHWSGVPIRTACRRGSGCA